MAKEMNMDTLVKKLKTVSNTQDSIPMLSLWIIHHKAHHKQIVETWLNMLKKCKYSPVSELLFFHFNFLVNQKFNFGKVLSLLV